MGDGLNHSRSGGAPADPRQRQTTAKVKRRAYVAWLAAAAMSGVGLWHAQHGIAAFREYRRWRTSDPSLADFFWTELEIEIAFAVACLAVALVSGLAGQWLVNLRNADEHT